MLAGARANVNYISPSLPVFVPLDLSVNTGFTFSSPAWVL
jgi:hypothetical protein